MREAGIPLETFKTKSKEGKSIAIYKFGDLSQLKSNRSKGRSIFSKEFKRNLYVLCGGRCAICHGSFEERYLQVDHRVPYEVGGDDLNRTEKDYILLCGSCNRAKSWSCEHCKNWLTEKKPSICMECYWGSPENYNHIALEAVRRLDVQWSGDEVGYYDAVKLIAKHNSLELPDFVKQAFKEATKSKNKS